MSRDQRSAGPLLGRGTKMIGSLIGAGTEAYAHHKAKKEQASGQQTAQQSNHEAVDERDEQKDEEDWALDDASGELSAEERHHQYHHASLFEMPGLDTPTGPILPLPCPVVLPQRRPQTKTRGFVRAYGPLLGECKGIDETMFLRFLDEFYEQTQASQLLQAVNVAGNVVGMVPSVAAMAVSAALNVSAKAGTEVQGRYKTNTYLDQVNRMLFNPRNLHCVIMTFQPKSSQKVVEVNMNSSSEAIMKNMNSSDSAMGKMKGSAGKSRGEFAIPEAAPLVYPALDKVAFAVSEDGQPLPAHKQNALKRSSAFIKDYLDRRAQAEYAGAQGEGSKLSVPGATDQQKFASRYSDPNHPANSGSILALLTGGAVDPRAKLLGRKADFRAKVTGQQLSEQDHHNVAMGRGAQGARQGIRGSLRKVLKEDVLYLLIAEIPSPQEMAELARLEH